jgi:glycerophosphoryl diester phosphodiesterase
MIPNRARFHEFEETGIPWSNVVAFVGHTPPKDKQLLKMLHEKSVLCIAGTSRNLDRKLTVNRASGASAIEEEYRVLLQRGVDLIETDAPREVGKLLYSKSAVPASKSRFFHSP